MFVAPRPARAADPLHPPGWTDRRIVGYGITGGVVQIMRPVVQFLRTRLDGFPPCAGLFDIGRAVGNQDPHDFAHGDSIEVFRDNEVDEVVDIRESIVAQSINRDLAVKIAREDMFASFLNILFIFIQTVHLGALVRAQCGGQTAIPTRDVDNEAPLDTCRIQDPFCLLLGLGAIHR